MGSYSYLSYLYTIFSNVVSDPKEYQNIKNIIDSIVELNRKFQILMQKKKKN